MIQEETPVYVPGETQHSILLYAAMAAKWKEPPRDALDIMVLGQADIDSLVRFGYSFFLSAILLNNEKKGCNG